MTESAKGIAAIIVACVVWGLSSLYYAMLKDIPPLEVLSHRSLWSLAFFAVMLRAKGQLGLVRDALSEPRRASVVVFAGLTIAGNWFGFIFAVSNGYAVEASLGYFIFPLVAVLLGRTLLGERLMWLQWIAIATAAIAVLVLTLGLGVAPWIALWLAGTMAGYGIAKKRLTIKPMVSVAAEVVVLAPLAILWLWFKGSWHDPQTMALLAFSGILTGAPLVLFSYAAQKVKLSTVGLLQYLNPTLQFLCATLAFGEPVTRWHLIAFPMIWGALALYSVAVVLGEKTARKRAVSAGTSVTTST